MKTVRVGNRTIHMAEKESYQSEIIRIEEIGEIGETDLRYMLAHGSFTGEREVAEEWLRQQSESRRDEREAKMLKIVESARADASSARIAAIIAATIAAAATIISAYIKVNSF